MTRISIPLDDLNETVKSLEDIGERINKTARLSDIGSKEEVGDAKLADSLADFDSAWGRGHEKVQENVKVFSENTKKISDAFTQTDDETVKTLDKSKA
ncbi:MULTISPECIES: hypothetical protein [unclassified Streptomyces]|uniref:hypothetical protein n=1 Tax=unclassified Streptomyces TaxID=2593676 RepID=UPI00093E778B|nr:hypothetical protein [Streptomyces sp. TSRI0281]OKI46495.1 hypothetical protein A6A29_27005 [Streptomyces sp. TSRI0281]